MEDYPNKFLEEFWTKPVSESFKFKRSPASYLSTFCRVHHKSFSRVIMNDDYSTLHYYPYNSEPLEEFYEGISERISRNISGGFSGGSHENLPHKSWKNCWGNIKHLNIWRNILNISWKISQETANSSLLGKFGRLWDQTPGVTSEDIHGAILEVIHGIFHWGIFGQIYGNFTEVSEQFPGNFLKESLEKFLRHSGRFL